MENIQIGAQWPEPEGDEGAAHASSRRAERLVLLIRSVKLIAPSGEFLCVLRDVSQTGISLRLFHPLPDTRDLKIEMQNGDIYPVELVWHQDERAGFRFHDPADTNRIVESPSDFTKRPLRLRLSAAVTMTSRLRRHTVELRDISQHGARIVCDLPLEYDQKLRISGGPLHEIRAKVRWQRDGCVGIAFEEPLQFQELALILREMQLA